MKKKYTLFRLYICFCFALFHSVSVFGFSTGQASSDSIRSTERVLTDAISAYSAKDYVAAIHLFENIKKECINELALNERSKIYYNLGSCYYRVKDYPHAVLSYQRALRCNPANKDAAFNLELTQSKLTDRFDAPTEMFFISWMRSWMHSQSFRTWGLWAFGGMLLTLLSISLCLFGRKIWLRKIALFFSVVCVLATILFHIFAAVQHERFLHEQQVVVMKTCETYATPTLSGKKVRTLNEGTLLRVVEKYNNRWLRIEMPDGKQAWMPDTDVENV